MVLKFLRRRSSSRSKQHVGATFLPAHRTKPTGRVEPERLASATTAGAVTGAAATASTATTSTTSASSTTYDDRIQIPQFRQQSSWSEEDSVGVSIDWLEANDTPRMNWKSSDPVTRERTVNHRDSFGLSIPDRVLLNRTADSFRLAKRRKDRDHDQVEEVLNQQVDRRDDDLLEALLLGKFYHDGERITEPPLEGDWCVQDDVDRSMKDERLGSSIQDKEYTRGDANVAIQIMAGMFKRRHSASTLTLASADEISPAIASSVTTASAGSATDFSTLYTEYDDDDDDDDICAWDEVMWSCLSCRRC